MDFNWKIRGGHKQETREGYNLLNNTLQSQTINGLEVTVNEDKSVKAAGTTTEATALIFDQSIRILSAGTYILTGCSTFIESEENYGGWNSGETKTFTTDATVSGSGFYKYYAPNEAVNETLYPMLASGSELKPYKPYGEMPSPNYPSEIETVGSNVNEFDINTVSYGDLDTATGKKINDAPNIQHSDYIEVASNEIYIINFNNTLTKRVFYLDKDKNVISTNIVLTEISKFTTSENVKYFRVKIVGVFDKKTKLEKGTIATPYSPYGMGSVEVDVVNKNYLTKAQQQTKTFNNVNFEINENAEINIQGLANASGEVVFELESPCKMSNLTNKIVELIVEGTPTATIGMRFLDGNTRLFELIPNSKTVTLNLDDTYINKNITAIQFYINNSADYNFIIKPGIYAEFQTEFTPHQSQTAIMPTQQEMLTGDYISSVEHHEWGKIESYNGETITTDYISTTGELTTGATVYYKLATPLDLELTEEQKTVQNQKLYTYKNVTNISLSDELASIDVEYKKDQDTINKNYENRLAALETVKNITNEEA